MTMTPGWTRLGIGLAAVALAITGAVASAHAAGVVSPCTEAKLDAALAGGGLVTFNCGGPATIVVASTKTISADTTIDGGGVTTVMFFAGGVFETAGTANFTVRNLTIAGSNVGIRNISTGAVTATNCSFDANGSSGIYNQGTGAVTATNCTFDGNSLGILNTRAGPVTATNCTFGGNRLGIANQGNGTATATNCTFDGNAYGIYNIIGPVTATNCTFGGNDYGIYKESIGPVTATNCLLADSIISSCAGAVTDGGHNLDDGTTCGFAGTGCTTPGGTSLCNTAPGLAAGLADNGGPTQTIALLPGSPAIGTADWSVCAAPPVNGVDQRGFPRAFGCDIGAFEVQSPPAPVASPAGVLGLVALLAAVGGLGVRRRASR